MTAPTLRILLVSYLILNTALARADSSGTTALDDTKSKDDATPVLLDKVVVTGTVDSYTAPGASIGSKELIPLREIPNSVSVITQQRIQDLNLFTVADALNQVTGVTVISNDTTQSQYYSRGYVLSVINDGIPAYNGLSGYEQLDLAIYDRVEVLRGPSGVFIGTGNIGGVVNLVRKRPEDTFDFSSTSTVGSWNDYRTELDATGPLNQSRSVRARIVAVGQDRDFFYDRSHDRKWVGYGTLDWSITPSTTLSVWTTVQDDHTKISFTGVPAWSTGGLLNVPRSTNPYPSWNRYSWKTKDYGADFEQRLGSGWVLRARTTRRDQEFYFKDGFPYTGVDPVANTVTYYRRAYDYNYRRDAVDFYASGPLTVFDRTHHLLVGYNYDSLYTGYVGVVAPQLQNILFGHPELVPDFDLPDDRGGQSKSTQSGYYGQLRASITDPLTLVLGGRISKFDTKSYSWAPGTVNPWTWGAKATHEFTPYAALIYDLTKQLSVYGSYADIFIPQSQLKVSGEALNPRRGKQYEVGTKGEFFDKKLIASVAVFDLKDKGRAFPVEPTTLGRYVNAGEVESKGWETEVSGSPYPGVELQAGYTRLDTAYAKDKANQGLIFDTWEPRHTYKFWAKYEFQKSPFKGLTTGLGINYASRSWAGTGTSAVRTQSGYSVVSALVGYNITPHLSANLNANNLFDTIYYTRLGGTNTYNTYGDPRNFTLTVRYSFK